MKRVFAGLALAALTTGGAVAQAQPAQAGAPAAQAEDELLTEEVGAPSGDAADPWEGWNRKVFAVNMAVDRAVLIPLAEGYRAVTPKVGRRGLRRFLAHIKLPVVFVNDVLQGEVGRAGQTLSRFVVNSTIGAGGFGDPMAHMGVAPHTEDFGQTLAVWGVGPGPYLVAPFFGPTTLRDGIGSLAQIPADPLFHINTGAASAARYSRTGAGALSAREQFLDPLREIEANSLDLYSSYRSFYLQARKREIANGETDLDALPDFEEFEE